MIKVVNITQGLLTVDSLHTKLKHGEHLEFASWAEAVSMAPELAVYRTRVPPRIAVVELKPAEPVVKAKPAEPSSAPVVKAETNGAMAHEDPEIARLRAILDSPGAETPKA